MGTGKKKIEIKKKEKAEQRMVTFSKRRKGLFKKAHELRSKTGADIAVLVFSPAGRPYTHGDPSFDAILDRYQKTAVEEANHDSITRWWQDICVEDYNDVYQLLRLKKELEDIKGEVAKRIEECWEGYLEGK